MTDRWRTILAIDHDRHAAETYRANVACDRVVCGDVRDMIADLPPADVVLGGPPCQPFSIAGKRLGFADARDGVPDFLAAVVAVRPRQFLMEQVPGFASFDDGRYMQSVVSAMAAAGYDVDCRELDAVNYGVPQFRRRLWLWGIRRDLPGVVAARRWPKPTHVWPWPDQPCMFGGDLLPAVTVGQALGLDGCCVRIIGGGSNPRFAGDARTERDVTDEPSTTIPAAHTHNAVPAAYEYRWSRAMREKHPPASPASPAPTVQAKWHKGGAEGLIEALAAPTGPYVRRLTPDECARLQSMPDDFRWPESVPKTHRYRIIGNGWSSLMARRMSEALAAADPESRTVIDLFCGGGCGAVGWHGRAWREKGGRR